MEGLLENAGKIGRTLSATGGCVETLLKKTGLLAVEIADTCGKRSIEAGPAEVAVPLNCLFGFRWSTVLLLNDLNKPPGFCCAGEAFSGLGKLPVEPRSGLYVEELSCGEKLGSREYNACHTAYLVAFSKRPRFRGRACWVQRVPLLTLCSGYRSSL